MKPLPSILRLPAIVALLLLGTAARAEDIPVDVLRAFDPRLPALEESDLREVFAETNRTLEAKLGTDLAFRFEDRGQVPVDQLFRDVAYLTKTFRDYVVDNQFRLDRLPPFDRHRSLILSFLKQWDLKNLAGFFPKDRVETYEDFYALLVPAYVSRVERLKKLRLPDGRPLLDLKGAPHQSYVHWEALMHEQDRFDLVFTNTLVVYDKFLRPYPHTVCKHAKVGGGAFESPQRRVFDGHSVMVNILEDYGGLPELSRGLEGLSRKERNRILAGFLMAHEFGHAFYYIPDVYDHGDACLMNSSFENLDHREGYRLLMKDKSACAKCKPYVLAREEVLHGHAALRRGEFRAAGIHYYHAAEITPAWLDTDRASYLLLLYGLARDAYARAGDRAGTLKAKVKLDALRRALREKPPETPS